MVVGKKSHELLFPPYVAGDASVYTLLEICILKHKMLIQTQPR